MNNGTAWVCALATLASLTACGANGSAGSSGGEPGTGGANGNRAEGGASAVTPSGTGGANGGSGAVVGGSGGSGVGGSSGQRDCPDPSTPPTACPPKPYPCAADANCELVLRTQADVDALEGYTDVDGLFIGADPGRDITNLEALHCLQRIHFSLKVTGLVTRQLGSLDGLREVREVGADVKIIGAPITKQGCGLKKLTKIGAFSATPALEITDNDELDRLEFPLLDSGVGNIFIERNTMLTSVIGSPSIMTLGQLFIDGNPALTSVRGFTGLMTVATLNVSENPLLPLCQTQTLVNHLSQPPAVLTIDGDTTATCR